MWGFFRRLFGSARSEHGNPEFAAELAAREERFARILESAMDAIISVDETQHIILFNPAAERMFGYSPEEAIGRPLDLLIPARYQEPHRELVRQFGQTGITSRTMRSLGELTGVRANGEEFPMEASISRAQIGGEKVYTVIVRDITGRRHMEAEQRQTAERLRATFEQAAVGIAHVSLDGRFLRANQKLCAMLGYASEELFQLRYQDILPPDGPGADDTQYRRVIAGEIDSYSGERRFATKAGALLWTNVTVSAVRHPPDDEPYFVIVVEDISARKSVEEQLLHAQKLESIGRLAGGIAHDFNNLLTAVLGFTEMALEKLPAQSTAERDLRNVLHAGERAAALTGQLLAFARRQMIEPRIIDLNRLLLDLDHLLRRVIGEDIELVLLPRVPVHEVLADPVQIEQVIVNLVVNARDAMEEGGKITIETGNAVLDEEYARQYAEVVPGEYTMIAITDTGNGMTEEVKRHIFEPFFTTKGPGKGTGLGLATCYGIVKQNRGHMWFYSEVGKGSTFKIYLPRATADDSRAVSEEPARALTGTETILVVEDEPLVRDFAVRALEQRGYTVLAAAHGNEALAIAEQHEGAIHLLLTDVVMPHMSGRELAERLAQSRPAVKILYTSGYTDNTIVHHGTLDKGVAFLQKPYTIESLTRRVREILDSG